MRLQAPAALTLHPRALKRRQNFPLINSQRLLFFPAHQVNIELRNARPRQRLQFLPMRLRGPDQTKSIDNFIRHELRVTAIDFAMMLIVVPGSILHVGSQGGRQFFRLVARDQIHHMIRNQRGKPAHPRPRQLQIIRHPNRRRRHDFNFSSISSRCLRALPDEAKHHSIKSGSANCKMTPSAILPARSSTLGPYPAIHTARTHRSPRAIRVGLSLIFDLSPAVSARNVFTASPDCRRDRLFAQHAPRTVAAPDAQLHAPAGNQIHRRKQTRCHGDVTHRRIGDTGPRRMFLRVGRHQRQQRIRLEPQDVRIEDPPVFETGSFRLPCQAQRCARPTCRA